MARKNLNFSFYIELPTEAKITPVTRTVSNNFDYMGDTVSLERLEGESNVDYKRRLWDVAIHPSGPTYTGALNGLARDLGMTRELGITIDLKTDSGGSNVASNPRINLLANKMVLYSDWRPNETAVLDREIKFFSEDDPGYILEDLVALINESPYFSCVLSSDIRPNVFSTNLVQGTTSFVIQSDVIEGHSSTNLVFDNLVQDSLRFIETEIFVTEVFTDPAADGEYKVDYENGIIYSSLVPSGAGGVFYHSYRFPFKVDYLPIQLYTLQDDNYQDELFHTVTAESGEEEKYLLNNEGSKVYHQLYKETKFFWGE